MRLRIVLFSFDCHFAQKALCIRRWGGGALVCFSGLVCVGGGGCDPEIKREEDIQ